MYKTSTSLYCTNRKLYRFLCVKGINQNVTLQHYYQYKICSTLFSWTIPVFLNVVSCLLDLFAFLGLLSGIYHSLPHQVFVHSWQLLLNHCSAPNLSLWPIFGFCSLCSWLPCLIFVTQTWQRQSKIKVSKSEAVIFERILSTFILWGIKTIAAQSNILLPALLGLDDWWFMVSNVS